MSDAVLYSVENGVAKIRLNRPDARNALNLAMCDGLADAARRAAEDAAIKLVLVRGEGKVFCAGADVKERVGMDAAQVRARRTKGFEAYAALEALPMPVVAIVEGPAVGSGCEIAASCDFIVATPAASFRTPEAIRGTVGATQRLARVLGKRLAKDMMYTGRALTAEEALEHGLVARLVPPEALEETVASIAKAITEAPQYSLRLAKRTIDRGVELDPKGALAAEIEAIEEQLASGQWMGKS
jgi:enoyl-CoA hydratase